MVFIMQIMWLRRKCSSFQSHIHRPGRHFPEKTFKIQPCYSVAYSPRRGPPIFTPETAPQSSSVSALCLTFSPSHSFNLIMY